MPSPSTRPEVQLTTERLVHRYPGLAHLLALLTTLALLLPSGAYVVFSLARSSFGTTTLGLLERLSLDGLGWGIVIALLLAPVAFLASFIQVSLRATTTLRADEQGLHLTAHGRTRLIPRRVIQGGIVVPDAIPRLDLNLTAGRTLSIALQQEEDAAHVLDSLGAGPERRRVAVSVGSAHRELAAGCLGFPAAAMLWSVVTTIVSQTMFAMGSTAAPLLDLRNLGLPITVILAMATVWALRRLVRPTRVVIGSDGVLVEHRFKNTWIPFAELQEASAAFDALTFYPRDSDSPVIELRLPEAVAEGLAKRIRAARDAGATGSAEARSTELLERGGRGLDAFRADLRKLLARGAYRQSGLTSEDVLATLADAQAPRERRIGAAIALRIAEHPEARARIRIAAEASADDTLRAALEEAAEAELDLPTLDRLTR
ncbi:hypothetical protein [Chondromyces apiculatus]|uniref:Uncharacterized protein n=1 Tax=Chondromyces apiculatus DSM 436 TaxID=1192034 RepID=A0A017T6W5_9BACT|nr:hypothetical protein [Chondromyces apiculatus]EYF04520.1 Hypothetical protein CAP_4488 [Chondromyces apiculatus DSM 436]